MILAVFWNDRLHDRFELRRMMEKVVPDGNLEYEEDRQLAKVLSTLIWASWSVFLIVFITAVVYADRRMIIVALLGSVALLLPMVLLRRRHLHASSVFTMLIMVASVTFLATIGQGIRDFSIIGFPILFIFAGLMLDRKYFRLCVGLSIVALGWLAFGESFNWFTPIPFTYGLTANLLDLIELSIILLVAALGVDLLVTNIRRNLERARAEIALRKQMEQEVRNLSLSDELTGLYNRRGLTLLAEQEVKRAHRCKRNMLLFFADVDDLKTINDVHGHAQGDLALQEISTILKEAFREVDIKARIGGDEFVVLAVDASMGSADILTNRIQSFLEKSNQQGDRPYQLSVSLGIAHFDYEAPCTVSEMIAQADGRMYQQKQEKKSKTCTAEQDDGKVELIAPS